MSNNVQIIMIELSSSKNVRFPAETQIDYNKLAEIKDLSAEKLLF